MLSSFLAICILFAFLSGISKAITDLSEEGKIKGNPIYWQKNKSWVKKWKNGDKSQGERFWLSSRQLSFLTDAWHLFGLLERIGFIATYIFVGLLIAKSLWFIFLLFLYPFSMLIFHIFHDMSNILKINK